MMYTVPTQAFIAVAILLVPVLFFEPVARHVNAVHAGLALLACAGFLAPIWKLLE